MGSDTDRDQPDEEARKVVSGKGHCMVPGCNGGGDHIRCPGFQDPPFGFNCARPGCGHLLSDHF